MIQTLKTHYACPYCPSGKGVIAVDPAATIAWLDQHPGQLDFYVEEHPEQRVIVFDPDQPAGRQCPHIIAGSINIMLGRSLPRDGFRKISELTAEMTHPWFTINDPDHRFDCFLWQIVVGNHEPHQKPRAIHRVDKVKTSHQVPREGNVPWSIRMAGFIVVAMHAEEFFEGLKTCAEIYWRGDPDNAAVANACG